MADDDLPPEIRLMSFVSEDQLKEARKTRGAQVEDGTAQRDRPLFEILKENKDKKDAEFNERFKHRPPKALDEDETEFLDTLEMSKKEYERRVADEEEQLLRGFQAAVASQSAVVHEVKEPTLASKTQDKNSLSGKKNPPRGPPLGMVIRVKKAKVAGTGLEELETVAKSSTGSKSEEAGTNQKADSGNLGSSTTSVGITGLVSYSDESEDDDE